MICARWNLNEATLDGKWTRACEHVAAVLLVRHQRLVDEDLEEQVVDVGVGTR